MTSPGRCFGILQKWVLIPGLRSGATERCVRCDTQGEKFVSKTGRFGHERVFRSQILGPFYREIRPGYPLEQDL